MPRSRPFRVAVVDFDGTVSLIREGWAREMADVGVAALVRPVPGEVVSEIEEQMLRLSGRPSLVQMTKLAGMIAAWGVTPPSPQALHDEFLKRLFAKIDGRKRALADGSAPPEAWAVPGTHDLLRALRDRGTALYLVSGTEYGDVIEEMSLLKLEEFFGPRVYAPKPGETTFHKRAAIATILRDERATGDDLLGFGDGYSETVEVLAAGGVAVGVASVEVGQTGPCPRKSALLREWGADPIVADYRDAVGLVARLRGDG